MDTLSGRSILDNPFKPLVETSYSKDDEVRVKNTGDVGKVKFIGRYGLIMVDFGDAFKNFRNSYNPEELEKIERIGA